MQCYLSKLFTHSNFNINKLISLRPTVITRHFYDVSTNHDTIYAPCTPTSLTDKGSPLGVIRISGPQTANVIKALTGFQVTRGAGNNVASKCLKPRVATLTRFHSPDNKELIDIGISLWFPKPHSYTGEDVCELHLHGSQAILAGMMKILGSFRQVRPAEGGEFTRRAFQNKKISLLEAESLAELIASKSDKQRRLALTGLDGSTRKKYARWTEDLVNILAHLEASIDFGEDELLGEERVVHECIIKIGDLADELHNFITLSGRIRQIVHSGWKVAILGKPNAGKSSLMNILCKRDKSIVSDLSGTTRDVIEHSFELGGHAISLSDTAGLRCLDDHESNLNVGETNDSCEIMRRHHLIEQQGISKALEEASKSHVILYVIDAMEMVIKTSHDIMPAEHEQAVWAYLFEEFRRLSITLGTTGSGDKTKLIHFVVNKIDQLNARQMQDLMVIKQAFCRRHRQSLEGSSPTDTTLAQMMAHDNDVAIDMSFVSCKTHENIEASMEQLIAHLNDGLQPSKNNNELARENTETSLSHERLATTRAESYDYANERHLALLKSSLRHLQAARAMNLNTVDEMAQHIRESVSYLARVVGFIDSEQVIDVIFRDFCIGK